MACRICDNDEEWLPGPISRCRTCSLILHQLKSIPNTPARERLHQINIFLASGVDD